MSVRVQLEKFGISLKKKKKRKGFTQLVEKCSPGNETFAAPSSY